MVFEIALAADPLLQQISFLLSPISGIESRINASLGDLRKLTVDSANTAQNNAFALFRQLQSSIEGQAQNRFDEVQRIIDAIIQNAGISIADIGGPIGEAAEQARIQVLIEAERTRKAIEDASKTTETAIQNAANDSQGIFGFLLGELEEAIKDTPVAFALELKPIFTTLLDSLSDQETALGGGFSFLGASQLLGLAGIGEILQNIFRIEPGDLEEGIAKVMPSIIEMSRVAGEAILKE